MKRLGYGGESHFVIVVYDVHKSRCTKVMKYLRQWLEHRQRSVFSGFLTQSQLEIMKTGLMKITVAAYDSVIVFHSSHAAKVNEWTTSGAERMMGTAIISDHSDIERALSGVNTVLPVMKKNGFAFRFSKLKKPKMNP